MDSGIVNTIASAMTQSSLPTMPNVYRADGTTQRAVKTQLVIIQALTRLLVTMNL